MQWFNQRAVWSIHDFFINPMNAETPARIVIQKRKKEKKVKQKALPGYRGLISASIKRAIEVCQVAKPSFAQSTNESAATDYTSSATPRSPSLLQLNRRIFLVKRERVSRVSSNHHPLSGHLLSRHPRLFAPWIAFDALAGGGGGGGRKGREKAGRKSRERRMGEGRGKKERRVGGHRKRKDNTNIIYCNMRNSGLQCIECSSTVCKRVIHRNISNASYLIVLSHSF